MAKHQSPVNALHRSIFVGLCNGLCSRQEARGAWAKISKGQAVGDALERRWRAAGRLVRKQVDGLIGEMHGHTDV